jgi:hypothetical protein
MERVTYLEGTDWYIEEFEKRLAAKTAHELWPANTAINRLLQRIEDPAEKGAVRVMAIKELNVLTGVTVIDEKGNTRAGRSLEDFYKSAPTNEALAKGAADVAIPAAANPAAAKAREAANGTKLH